jgi:hypothetical protein
VRQGHRPPRAAVEARRAVLGRGPDEAVLVRHQVHDRVLRKPGPFVEDDPGQAAGGRGLDGETGRARGRGRGVGVASARKAERQEGPGPRYPHFSMTHSAQSAQRLAPDPSAVKRGAGSGGQSSEAFGRRLAGRYCWRGRTASGLLQELAPPRDHLLWDPILGVPITRPVLPAPSAGG